VTHANAALTPRGRLKLARLIVEQRCPISQAATRFQVSWPTAKRWAKRYELEGEAGMADRSSRPHSMPAKTPAPVVRKIVHLRWKQRLGPVEIAARVGVAASTAHQVLVRCRISRLSHVDRATGEPVRRYEHPHPGSMIHVDVKKLGNIPDQGGWRYVGRAQGAKNRAATPGKPRNARRQPNMGTACVHTVIDDHSRVAYAEVRFAPELHLDRGLRLDQAAAVWRQADKPQSEYNVPYWERLQKLRYDFLGGDIKQAASIALRFTLSAPGVHTAIVGTKNPNRWRENAELLAAGPLPQEMIDKIRARWRKVADSSWVGQI